MSRELANQRIDTPPALGARIRTARKAQGLTQADLAGIAGVGTRFISDLERGKETIRFGLTLHVVRLLGIDLYAISRDERREITP